MKGNEHRRRERHVKIGLQIPSFTIPAGPASLGSALAGVARTADDAGIDMLAVMDHFWQIGVVGPPEQEMLEAYTTLGFLAAHTSRARLLTVMTGVIYRHPGILIKQLSTLDVLSGGRAILGIGAAWNEHESRGLGVPFPPLAQRFEQLEETLRIARQMFAGDETPFEGKHYQLERPLNSPAPLRRPPIMVGGQGEKKTLRLVAKYADACNLFPTPELPHKLDVLRGHCENEGRDYDEILKTVIYTLDPAKTTDEQTEALSEFAALGIGAVIVNTPNLWEPDRVEQIGELVATVADL
jgi:F420-dependent oxidoreductase-like protein